MFGVRVMVFYATFNNISIILWRSVLSVEETGVPGENYRPAPIHLSHNVVSSTPLLSEIRIHNVSGDSHVLCLDVDYFVYGKYNVMHQITP